MEPSCKVVSIGLNQSKNKDSTQQSSVVIDRHLEIKSLRFTTTTGDYGRYQSLRAMSTSINSCADRQPASEKDVTSTCPPIIPGWRRFTRLQAQIGMYRNSSFNWVANKCVRRTRFIVVTPLEFESNQQTSRARTTRPLKISSAFYVRCQFCPFDLGSHLKWPYHLRPLFVVVIVHWQKNGSDWWLRSKIHNSHRHPCSLSDPWASKRIENKEEKPKRKCKLYIECLSYGFQSLSFPSFNKKKGKK